MDAFNSAENHVDLHFAALSTLLVLPAAMMLPPNLLGDALVERPGVHEPTPVRVLRFRVHEQPQQPLPPLRFRSLLVPLAVVGDVGVGQRALDTRNGAARR